MPSDTFTHESTRQGRLSVSQTPSKRTATRAPTDLSSPWRSEAPRRSSCSFFFQAEDGIRDLTVTGVQTCALPISTGAKRLVPLTKIGVLAPSTSAAVLQFPKVVAGNDLVLERTAHARMPPGSLRVRRSEERRVGGEGGGVGWRAGWRGRGDMSEVW